MALTKEQTALTLLAVAEVPQFFSGFLPSYFTIATFARKEGTEWTKRNIRIGELISASMAIGMGLVVATIIDNPAPLWGTAIMSGLLILFYERALRNPSPPERGLTTAEGGEDGN